MSQGKNGIKGYFLSSEAQTLPLTQGNVGGKEH